MRGLRIAFIGVVIGALLAHGAAAQTASGGARAIDPAKSQARFTVAHIFVDHVTGTVPLSSGMIAYAAGSLVPARVDATLDPARIESGEPDRDRALAGPDYFDTQRFPLWTFASTAIVVTGPATFAMDGLLTIHGITRPERLAVTIGGDAAHPVYHAAGQIDRRVFGMKGQRLDPVIGTLVDVTLDIAVR